MAHVRRKFSPLTIEFIDEKEWEEFRSFLNNSYHTILHRQDRWITSRELNPHEQQVAYTLKGILDKTA